ncbi:MAG: UDP-N-acetylglucosamine 2-epimerase [Pseudobdellovibrio sp.]
MKKVLFFTSTRADYGLLSGLIKTFKADSSHYTVEILVTGTHLSEKYGLTYREIEADGVSINYKVDLNLKGDSDLEVARATALGVEKFSEILSLAQPDLVFVLGDRTEALSFALASQLMRVPLAHLHGGEVTEGAIDDAMRHCITKLAKIHFASAEEHKKRVEQLGEDPKLVFNVGAVGIDNIVNLQKLNKQELEQQLQIAFKERTYLVTFHPETLSQISVEDQIDIFLKGLEKFILAQEKESLFIFTMPNADSGNQSIFKKINDFIHNNSSCCKGFESLGYKRYLSAMSYATAVVGNSSSGLIEAPALNIPTLNVGDRQKGRLRGTSVIDVPLNVDAISEGLNLVTAMKEQGQIFESPYGDGHSAEKIKTLVDKNIDQLKFLRKIFYDKNY